ncbi:MAG: Crp/Fnr family transcriptional regulator [Pseudonocardiales bacterium]|nr:MAG: Crp/Fnr family transcriptional regulator [Pseudonocardiales bacterium]
MSSPVAHPADLLAEVDVFAGLEQELRSRIAAAAVRRSYRRGQLLFVEGDRGDSLLVLLSGAVSVFRSAPSGERALLSVVRPPDVLGEVSILDGSNRSASAEAIDATTALSLSRPAFLDLVHSQPALLDAVLRSLGGLVRRLTDQTADYVFLDLAGRVAKTLVRLAGAATGAPVVIELSQTQLAEMVGGSRQSVNQALGTFAVRGWLHVEGRRVALDDLAALRRRAGAPS